MFMFNGMLSGNLGSVGYRSQRHTYNPLPVLIATLFEILYEAAFAEVEVKISLI